MTGPTIAVPDDLADDLRIAAVVRLASTCNGFDTVLGGFAEPRSWDVLHEEMKLLERSIAVVRALGVTKGSTVAEPISHLDVESLARDAAQNVLDDIRNLPGKDPLEAFERTRELRERGVALLALAEAAADLSERAGS